MQDLEMFRDGPWVFDPATVTSQAVAHSKRSLLLIIEDPVPCFCAKLSDESTSYRVALYMRIAVVSSRWMSGTSAGPKKVRVKSKIRFTALRKCNIVTWLWQQMKTARLRIHTSHTNVLIKDFHRCATGSVRDNHQISEKPGLAWRFSL